MKDSILDLLKTKPDMSCVTAREIHQHCPEVKLGYLLLNLMALQLNGDISSSISFEFHEEEQIIDRLANGVWWSINL